MILVESYIIQTEGQIKFLQLNTVLINYTTEEELTK